MLPFAKTLQVILCILMVALILVQSKSSGLSSSFKSSFSMYRSLRGVEKIIFVSTLISGVLLVFNSLAIVLLS